jgi:DNA-binding FadR family transcriptional regulator
MADVERERVTALWREAAAALEEPSLVEIRSRAEAVLDNARAKFGSLVDDSRGGTVELARDVLTVLAECGRLREQLGAARQALAEIDDDELELVDTFDLAPLRAALGVGDE